MSEEPKITEAGNASRERNDDSEKVFYFSVAAYAVFFTGTVFLFDLSSSLWGFLLIFGTPICGLFTFALWLRELFRSEKPKYWTASSVVFFLVSVLYFALFCILKNSFAT